MALLVWIVVYAVIGASVALGMEEDEIVTPEVIQRFFCRAVLWPVLIIAILTTILHRAGR